MCDLTFTILTTWSARNFVSLSIQYLDNHTRASELLSLPDQATFRLQILVPIDKGTELYNII